ncbi:MAG: type I-E CRISPR-associated protein Cas7/Cse4/CasC, partial [Anaerolineales bacterium]|nr:type I-E CRISPR-associated protein Cas7/Cse4/CasC [Anaerolineales bacterium]
RTRRLPMLIDSVIQSMPGVPDDIRTAVISRVAEIGTEGGGSKPAVGDDGYAETNQLIFLGSEELGPLATSLVEFCTRKGVKDFGKMKIPEVTKELSGSLPRSVDIAMFGRMTTSNAFEDVAAAVQVAHAITTGKVDTEFDYYTAIDDLSGEAGAGMIGDVELNSSTYYKYFNIHWEGLVENLGGDKEVAAKAVLAFIEAAAVAQPSGKQNSTAALNLPDFVLVEVSDKNLPVNYANAYLKPVVPQGD